MRRIAVGLVGLGLAVPLAGVLLMALFTPMSPSGAGYLAAGVLLAGGLLGAAAWGKRALWVAFGGLALGLLVVGLRLAALRPAPDAPLRLVTLPAGGGPRWVNALVDEQDLLLFGEALMRAVGGVSRREHADLAPALTAGYAELRGRQGGFASPVLSTYLFQQGPRVFDAVVVEPEGSAPAAAVVFLHGFMGNVSLQCWEIAQPARALGMLTVCPSTGWIGDWWRPGGEATLRATLDYVRKRGVTEIYVGGFSNGGSGVSQLAASLAAEPGVDGLFFIAGVNQGPDIAATGLPVLIIQGALDERMGVAAAREAAAEIGAAATYVELEADHFLIVKEGEAVREALGGWLEER